MHVAGGVLEVGAERAAKPTAERLSRCGARRFHEDGFRGGAAAHEAGATPNERFGLAASRGSLHLGDAPSKEAMASIMVRLLFGYARVPACESNVRVLPSAYSISHKR